MTRYFIFSALFLLISCAKHTNNPSQMCSIQLIDRNGFSETITATERLKTLANTNYLASQPYQKVTRTFGKDDEGKARACITTYHPNGQLRQFLETKDGRAHGQYQEYFQSGQLRLSANVIEGPGDIDDRSQEDWLFEGLSRVWNEEGDLIAEIPYQKGYLEGLASYYAPSGKLQRSVAYKRGQLHGKTSIYDLEGTVIGFENYQDGLAQGITQFQGDDQTPAFRESYKSGKLIEATYFDTKGHCCAEIRLGKGQKAIFANGALKQKITYQNGVVEGKVQNFAQDGSLISEYFLVDGKKHGEEWFYFASKPECEPRPKMCISWYEDAIHGSVKTWYEDGRLESEREMCQNKRHGRNFAWYKDGSLMLLEDYDQGLLKNGSYMKKGSSESISSVSEGVGIATIHDGDGFFLKTISYKKGRPVE